MVGFLTRRLAMAIATVLVAILLSFLLVHLTPGSPGELILGAGASKGQIAAENAKIGWSEPLTTQLWDYVSGLAHGDLGTSIIDGHPIGSDLLKRVPVTASIAVLATLLSGVVGVGLGVLATVRGRRLGKAVDLVSGIALSLPPFWLGVLLVYAVAISAGLLPATGYVRFGEEPIAWLESIALPVVALSIPGAAVVARTAHVSLRDSLSRPHIAMLRSLGTPPRRVFVHALRMAGVAIVAVLAIQFVALFSGSLIIENLFALPGLGQAAATAVTSHDFPAVEGVVVVAAIVVVCVNLLLDLVVAALDPRVRS